MTADRRLTDEEVAGLDCAMQAGLTPTRETVARMMATILHLQQPLPNEITPSASAVPPASPVSPSSESLDAILGKPVNLTGQVLTRRAGLPAPVKPTATRKSLMFLQRFGRKGGR